MFLLFHCLAVSVYKSSEPPNDDADLLIKLELSHQSDMGSRPEGGLTLTRHWCTAILDPWCPIGGKENTWYLRAWNTPKGLKIGVNIFIIIFIFMLNVAYALMKVLKVTVNSCQVYLRPMMAVGLGGVRVLNIPRGSGYAGWTSWAQVLARNGPSAQAQAGW